MSRPITRFSGRYAFLSNFYPVPVYVPGRGYFKSAEHAFQAAKTVDPREIKAVCEARDPGEAKRRGQRVTLIPEWEFVKEYEMKRILAAKFAHRTRLAGRLILTGDRELIEENHWGDSYWGVYQGSGQNRLGILLMDRRAELRSAFL